MRVAATLLPAALLAVGCGNSARNSTDAAGAAGSIAGTTGRGGAAGATGSGGATAGTGGTTTGEGGATAGTGGGAAGTGGGSAGRGGASAGTGGGGRGGTGSAVGGRGGSGGIGGTGGTGGAPCSDSVPCASGSFCERDTPSACDGPTLAGHCIVPPKGCSLLEMPVCGCDGASHYNDCARQAFSVHVDPAMRCAVPGDGGGIADGCMACDRTTQYCEMKQVGVFDPPYFSACRPLPTSCGSTATCACLADVDCGRACNTSLRFPIIICAPS